MIFPARSSTARFLLCVFPVAILSLRLPSFGQMPDVPSSPAGVTVSALNDFRLARGFDISPGMPEKPWNYLLNSSDLNLGFHGLYLKLRFDVEEPSMGFDPPEPVYREYLSRRTVGLSMAPLTIEAGHVSTQFGHGLTLSLKEDREIERYSILDGVYGRLLTPWITLTAIAGRPIEELDEPIAIAHDGDTTLTDNTPNLLLRDNIMGVYVEGFPPIGGSSAALFSGSSLGGGIVRYAENAGPLTLAYSDTVNLAKPFWYQSGQTLYFPSAFVNLTAGDCGLSIEQAWLTGTANRYVNSMDSLRGAYDSTAALRPSPASYVSARVQARGVSLLAEYKNYWYERSSVSMEEISPFLIPPSARYETSWHLLNKHLLSNLMDDVLGYNLTLAWTMDESSQLTINGSYGGRHLGASFLQADPTSAYWETYAELSRDVGDVLNAKCAADYGKLDPAQPSVTFRTLALKATAGPFRARHGFSLTLEGQLNDKPFRAERDIESLKALITREVPPDSLAPRIDPISSATIYKDTLQYDYLVPDDRRSRYTQYAVNLLSTLAYTYCPYLTLALTIEQEQQLDERSDVHLVTDLAGGTRWYASVSASIQPSEHHTLTVEYGSMSGGRRCTLGTCVDLPPFKGLRLTLISTF